MSLDSFNARALLLELQPLVVGSRAQKFSQLSELDFLLHLRAQGRTDKLLLSIHPERSRFHLLPEDAAHPPAIVPSSFVMLGRKHFGGCRLLEISMPGLERSLELRFSSGYSFVFDWAGKPSALLILTPDEKLCAGAFPPRGRFPLRQPYDVRAGMDSDALPQAHELSADEAWQGLQALPDEMELGPALNTICAGVSPLWVKRWGKEMGAFSLGSIKADGGAKLRELWRESLDPLRGDDASLLVPGLEKDGELSYRPRVEKRFASMSLAASERWDESSKAPGVPDHRSELLRSLRKGRDKSSRKMEKRQKDKKGAESAPRDQLFGDLLLAYASTITGRSSEFRTHDWEGRPVVIPLEPHLGVTDNANKYYTRGKKKKRALAVLDEQIGLAEDEIAFWDELIFAAEGAENRTDLEEIRKAVPGPRQGKKKRAPEIPSSGPRRFEHGGFLLLVGRNPAQNEKLSLRDAAKEDRWFHVRLGAGSHVLLKTAGKEPPESTLLAAAWLAATYSRSHLDARASIITTPARYLKKPKGGALGKVTYKAERELIVDPTSSPPEGLRRLDKKETPS